jgi:hypothetical protein
MIEAGNNLHARSAGESFTERADTMSSSSLARSVAAAIASNDPRHKWPDKWPGSDAPFCNLDLSSVLRLERKSRTLTRVIIRGDCNAPKLRDGEEVMFGPARGPRAKFVEGKLHLLKIRNGPMIVRRVFVDPLDRSRFLLRFGNRRKYPHAQRIRRRDVAELMPLKYRFVPVNETAE